MAKAERDRRHEEYYGTYLGDSVSTTTKSSGGTYVESEEARRRRSREADAQYDRITEQLQAAATDYEESVNWAASGISNHGAGHEHRAKVCEFRDLGLSFEEVVAG